MPCASATRLMTVSWFWPDNRPRRRRSCEWSTLSASCGDASEPPRPEFRAPHTHHTRWLATLNRRSWHGRSPDLDRIGSDQERTLTLALHPNPNPNPNPNQNRTLPRPNPTSTGLPLCGGSGPRPVPRHHVKGPASQFSACARGTIANWFGPCERNFRRGRRGRGSSLLLVVVVVVVCPRGARRARALRASLARTIARLLIAVRRAPSVSLSLCRCCWRWWWWWWCRRRYLVVEAPPVQAVAHEHTALALVGQRRERRQRREPEGV